MAVADAGSLPMPLFRTARDGQGLATAPVGGPGAPGVSSLTPSNEFCLLQGLPHPAVSAAGSAGLHGLPDADPHAKPTCSAGGIGQ